MQNSHSIRPCISLRRKFNNQQQHTFAVHCKHLRPTLQLLVWRPEDGISWRGVTSGGVFAFLWPTLPGPGLPSNGPTFWLKYFYETRPSYESLEPLVGFLAYLDEKSCHKNQIVVKNPTPKNGSQGGITPLLDMAITRH